MTKYGAAYLATIVVFFAFDFCWLSVMGEALYKPTLGDILLPKFLPAPALIFYLLYIVGVIVFCISPAFASGDWRTALVYGGLFGFFCYGTYDMTNMSTLRNWTLQITVADMIWGTVLTGVSASLGFLISRAALRALHLEGG